MAEVPCMCRAEICGHPDGGTCGKESEFVLMLSPILENDRLGPESQTGICDECWARVRPF